MRFEYYDILQDLKSGTVDLPRVNGKFVKFFDAQTTALPSPIIRSSEAFTPPRNLHILNESHMMAPPVGILDLMDTGLIGHSVFYYKDSIINELMYENPNIATFHASKNDLVHLEKTIFQSELADKKPDYIPGTTIYLNSTSPQIYHHWITNCLSRAYGYDRYKDEIDNVLIADGISPLFVDMLKNFGIPENKIMKVSFAHRHLKFERLLLPAPTCILNASIHPIFRNFFHEKLSLEDRARAKKPKDIYIGRHDMTFGTARRLLNEKNLVSKLNKMGVEVFVPGNHSFVEQVRTIFDARTITGLHGSGFCNIVFCREKTPIVLIEHPNKGYLHYWQLAALSKSPYHTVLGESFGVTDEKNPPQYWNWVVDIDEVERAILVARQAA